ncbi:MULTISPECIES: maleylacetoacetate isomerase [Rhizobium/Agrobacterium group]|uniref:maleylacetoacetate isomerase n=1 Tax=Rhizobium/Agrobacterium group TaxID=227290 RepID=UPI001ADAD09C|nr:MULTISPECIES: maleylacetoacetate isomerase [Rhizobium/Agrobacterium group]MBO9112662.1 maleylacetoacetate isomerase [Agrobacterium sp. S2/73]QXZ76153.1 maleylacetoacetate isomerase [Agrobacterium sp. S7/73]QYA17298.1 maleylacetoacetate isomerase [Rhizobium sp. AB2/73]UEQ85585.1 maleylacetoacetate isomerase [Rhizobium sp. AB2/73]
MTAEVRLYGYWRSSSTYRVRIALALAGISYSTTKVDLLGGEQVSSDNLSRSPLGLVPSLEIDGLLLTQSLSIVEYLDETRKLSLLPEATEARARVRALAHAIAMDIAPVCNQRVAKFANERSNSAIATTDWMKHFISLGLGGFEGMLEQAPPTLYCGGDSVTIADICLVPQIYNAARWGVNLSAYPLTTQINARLLELEAFRAAHPDVANTETA